jgi:hypothetical protein
VSPSFEFQTDLDETLRDRIKKIEENVGGAGLVRLFDRILGEGHKTAVTTMRDRYHLHNTGETEKFEIVRDSPLSGRINAISKIVGYLEWGTGIYGPNGTPIVPKTCKVLKFQDFTGQWVSKHSVQGTKPQHNMRDQVLPAEDRMIRREVDEAIAKAVS